MEIQAEALIKELQTTIANQALEIATLKVMLEQTIRESEDAIKPKPVTTSTPLKPVANGTQGIKSEKE